MPAAGARILTASSTMPVAWQENPRLPRGVAAALAALRFSAPAPELLYKLSDADWKSVLDFCGRAGLTLFLGALCRDDLPAWVAGRIARNIANNTERIGRLRAALVEIAAAFDARKIQYLLLKGFSHEIDYSPDPYLRVGYDLDLFAPAASLDRAHETLRAMDYVPIEGTEDALADHYPPLIRKTGWEFRGDFFDPEIPASVDLHYRFWDPATERIDAPGIEEFWERRITQDGIPVLDAPDRLAYAALHMLRHLFRPAVRALHVYEIAYFLETKSGDDAFWQRWRDLHSEPLRRLQAVAFRLAESWFGCRMAPQPAEEIARLDDDVLLWFERYAAAPIEAAYRPNKHELWLHLALLDSPRDRRQVFLRRVFPATLPSHGEAVYLPDDQVTWGIRLRRRIQYGAHLAGRLLHHARALPPLITEGLAWKTRASGLQAQFWWFVIGGGVYAFGLYIFFLLYNLFLLDRGYHEDALGLVAGGFTLGSIAGVLPAASLLHRIGLGRALKIVALIGPAALALRCVLPGELALVAAAFVAGVVNSVWVVAYSPTIAALTSERSRPAGFSITACSGIGVSMLAGLIGGRMPRRILGAHLAADALHAKQITLLASVAVAALSFWPLSKLRLPSAAPEEAHRYPGGPFVRRFLTAIAVWSLATGGFNPLFNAYFQRQFRMPLEGIGLVFTLAQFGQAATFLLAPLVLRRLGLVRGVAGMELITALALASLAASPSAYAAAALYVAYMSFQYMSEPGTGSLLMNQVDPARRGGASALFFLVTFLAQALAATAAGAIVTRYGYPPMLAAASILGVAAAWLFWRLPQESR